MKVSEPSPATRDFEAFLALLQGDLEVFLCMAKDLEARYGGLYRKDALFILNHLDAFARHQGETLGDVLGFYRNYVDRVSRERRIFQATGAWPAALGPDGDWAYRKYLYALTLSTMLTPSRYELFLDYRRALEDHLLPGSSILEIGAGNCLDAASASTRGRVEAYERNPLSRVWQSLLDPAGRIDLRIEECRFERAQAHDWVTMIELLEHLPDPATYLEGALRVLRDDGLAYMTFALRMPQADHLWPFQSVEECRELLQVSGFRLVRDHCLIDTCMPYEENERWSLAEDSTQAVIYCCLARKHVDRQAASRLADFNAQFED